MQKKATGKKGKKKQPKKEEGQKLGLFLVRVKKRIKEVKRKLKCNICGRPYRPTAEKLIPWHRSKNFDLGKWCPASRERAK